MEEILEVINLRIEVLQKNLEKLKDIKYKLENNLISLEDLIDYSGLEVGL